MRNPQNLNNNAVCKPDYNPAMEVVEKDGAWYLTVHLEKSWSEKIKPILVTGKLLGMAVIPKQSFEDTNGNPVRFNTDYSGIERNANNPGAGPFEINKNGYQHIKVW